jgi:hypothetical protein
VCGKCGAGGTIPCHSQSRGYRERVAPAKTDRSPCSPLRPNVTVSPAQVSRPPTLHTHLTVGADPGFTSETNSLLVPPSHRLVPIQVCETLTSHLESVLLPKFCCARYRRGTCVAMDSSLLRFSPSYVPAVAANLRCTFRKRRGELLILFALQKMAPHNQLDGERRYQNHWNGVAP